MKKPKQLLTPGHNACSGCGQMIAARTAVEAIGPNAIIANATGCLEVTTTPYPKSAWALPWIHSLFENPAAIASGLRAAYNQKEKGSKKKIDKIVAFGGDGSTFDIGFGLLSGMWERGEDILYICFDNEAYANTGIQASGSTPWAASTTTTPAGTGKTIDAIGSHQRKKNMIDIALAHGLTYIAETTAGYPVDIKNKVKKAMSIKGPSYIQILIPCVPGWKINSADTIRVGKLAAMIGLYPVLEYENGELTKQMKVPKPKKKVDEYLKTQGRFKHLFKDAKGEEQIKKIQQIADKNIEKYNLY